MLYKRYSGEFLSTEGTRWRVELWQESAAAWTVGELTFPAEEPLVIEWSGKDKLEPVISSAATLKIVSDTDRRFVDLYQVKIGQVRLDVYRENALYWSGMLDTEIYEEPFADKDGYEVTLTFADFAILQRIKYTEEMGRFKSLREMINLCLGQTGLQYSTYTERITTTAASVSGSLTDVCHVISDNFYDEDGEAMTLREILDEVLRPFALRLIQKGGTITVFDTNALYEDTATLDNINWDSTDSVLGVDKTYNNAELTFSPYMKNTLAEMAADESDIKDSECTTHRIDTNYDDNVPGFDLMLKSGSRSGNMELFGTLGAKLFKIKPIYSGDADCGAAFIADRYDGSNYTKLCMPNVVNVQNNVTSSVRLTDTPYIHVTPAMRDEYMLRLQIENCIDVRYNPFEGASDGNEEGNYDRFKNNSNYGYIPFQLLLRNAAGQALYYYDNTAVYNSNSISTYRTGREWKPAGGADGWDKYSFAAYYQKDTSSRKKDTGWGGWQTNRPIIGYYRKRLPSVFDKMFDGEYIPMPPVSGWLELRVGCALRSFDYKSENTWQTTQDWNDIHWNLLKRATINVVDKYGLEMDETDVVMRSYVERDAEESLSIDTIIGTLETSHPTARGQIFASNGATITRFERAGVTDRLERLLLGTVYSQYHGRKRMLSGTARLLRDFSLLSDAAEPGKYLVIEETQDLGKDQSEVKMVEVGAEEYRGQLIIDN